MSEPDAANTLNLLVPLSDLHESPWNPRRHYNPKKLEELAGSMRKVGVLAPLLLRPRPAGGYEIAAGHRRKRAAAIAKLDQVPAIIRALTDQEFLEVLTIENLQREDVHPLDEGEGYRTLMKAAKWDVETVAAKVGKSVSYVYQRLKLVDLIEPAKKAFIEDKITAGHAILIARLQPGDQKGALKRCEPQWDGIPSVRELSRWIENEIHLDLHSAPWKKEDVTLVRAAGACLSCPKRSGFTPALFPDLAKKDVCLDRKCFGEKREAFTLRLRAEFEAKGEKLLDLSTSYSRGPKGTISQGTWRDAVKAKSCPTARTGIIVDGDHQHKAGQLLTVCVEPTCKVHRPHGGHGPSPGELARRKAEAAKTIQQQTMREALHAAIRAKVTAPLPRAVLEFVAVRFVDDIWHELRVKLIRLWGWGGSKPRSEAYGLNIGGRLGKLSANELARFLADLAVARDLHVSPYDRRGPDALKVLAKHYRVDAGKIERTVRAELASKAKAAAARKKRREKAAKNKATVKTYSVATCTKCGCTEAAACKGGCSWVKLNKTTNAGL